ncbi:ATP-binding cassette domain-containing protein [Roseateles sp. SL47]|uniref:ATP-binding cassette domain-containing protein n=1 Tax=Roseateles sp. SL47 TaxID=2995138 RepID=UPI00226DE19A|nr:ATP-binding cassette domain-containing protein [Roseateles sp. SL47]WAC75035.1 ATP-binding cassette domain-containing protein [Roseateles sp. SL47]
MLVMNHVRLLMGDLRLGPIHLRLMAGERVAILGPSGAGKSTLLRLMSRELQPSEGEVLLDRRPLSAWSPQALARRRAVLPQQQGVAFGLPVELVVALGRVARQQDPDQSEIVQQALVQAQADHLIGRRFDTLSGGEQARVQLARVLAQAWDEREGLLLVDEPLAALDPGLTLSLMHAISRFAAQRGHALVAVLHDVNLALNHFDRLWMVKDGRLIADCDALPSTQPLLEQLYGTRMRLLQDEHGMAMLPMMTPLQTPLTAPLTAPPTTPVMTPAMTPVMPPPMTPLREVGR